MSAVVVLQAVRPRRRRAEECVWSEVDGRCPVSWRVEGQDGGREKTA